MDIQRGNNPCLTDYNIVQKGNTIQYINKSEQADQDIFSSEQELKDLLDLK